MLILVIFVLLALLWLTREPKFIPGWGQIFQTEESGKRLKDNVVAIICACMYIVHVHVSFFPWLITKINVVDSFLVFS